MQSSLAESTYKYAVAGWFEEMARLVKSFKFAAPTGLHLRKADEKTTNYLFARTQHFKILLTQYRALVVFKVLITASMLIVGVILLLDTQINIGQFVAAEIIIITVINSVEKIIVNLDSVYDTLTAVEKVSKLTDKPVEGSGTYLLSGEGGISLRAENLTFGYDDRPVIRNLNFRIEPGEKVAISGKDGNGKSTLLKVLTGVFREVEGSLMYNDVPIGNYNITSLRQKTGIFFLQENIFNGTLWENLTMGREVNVPYVNRLVQETGLDKFLQTVPQGFDTMLDPAGMRLPGNVVQKILIVRALSHKPRLLLMEEPWRGVEDSYREGIQALLLSLTETTVIVATNDERFIARTDRNIQL
jgi:ABC-type bacteriocin/lantibiotic exporter with double-glycine peptidase domain